EEDFDRVLATGPDLYRLLDGGNECGKRISRGAHVFADGFVEIHDTIRIRGGGGHPADRSSVFSRVHGRQIDAFLGREFLLEPRAAATVKGTDQQPLPDEAEVGRYIDLDPQRQEVFDDFVYLIAVARPGEGFAQGFGRAG